MADRINELFSNKEMHGCFAGQQKSGRNNEVTVLLRWPIRRGSIVYGYHSVLGLKRHKLLFILIL